jgi:hypothetical protein
MIWEWDLLLEVEGFLPLVPGFVIGEGSISRRFKSVVLISTRMEVKAAPKALLQGSVKGVGSISPRIKSSHRTPTKCKGSWPSSLKVLLPGSVIGEASISSRFKPELPIPIRIDKPNPAVLPGSVTGEG